MHLAGRKQEQENATLAKKRQETNNGKENRPLQPEQ
jgi:hypothetical protein